MFKYQQVEDNVLVEPIEKDKELEGGFKIIATKVEKAVKWSVVAVWPWKYDPATKSYCPMDVAVGDIVHFVKYAPDEIEVVDDEGKKKTYLHVKYSAILAVEKAVK